MKDRAYSAAMSLATAINSGGSQLVVWKAFQELVANLNMVARIIELERDNHNLRLEIETLQKMRHGEIKACLGL